MQLDLHGKTWSETLPEFIELYNHAVRQQSGESLDIIHGYGSTGTGGILRKRIRGYLQRQRERLQFKPGEEVDGNQGHTVVVPIQPLLETADLLLEQILEYCDSPRAQSRITFPGSGGMATRRCCRPFARWKSNAACGRCSGGGSKSTRRSDRASLQSPDIRSW